MHAVFEQLVVRIDPDLKEWIDQKAEAEGRTIKSVVCRILDAQRKREQAQSANRQEPINGGREN